MGDTETATLESATLESGNTKGGLKKRDWFVTINEKSLENYNEIRSYFENRKSCTYVLCVEHIGEKISIIIYSHNLKHHLH